MNRRNVLAAGLALPGLMAARERTRATGTPSAVDEWAQPEWFVDPEWIFDHLADESVQIIALTPDQDFLDGHLPGAVQIDWPDLTLTDSADATVDAWRKDVERRLTDLGVSTSSTVVIYDGGTFYAPRLWWILDQLGHADKRILDGGLPAWREARIETETGQAEIQLALEPYVGTPNEDALARIDEVAMVSEKGGGVLVDARTPEEFERGRIPNAVNVPFLENSENGNGGKWKSPSQLRGMYEDEGATPEKRVIAYCSTGVRSAATYLTLKALGYEQVKLYSASFEEWSSDPTRPIETRVGS